MPGDPKECRQHALNCVQLAKTAASPQAREEFANLARTWIRLADDLERTLAFLVCWRTRPSRRDEPDSHKRSPGRWMPGLLPLFRDGET